MKRNRHSYLKAILALTTSALLGMSVLTAAAVPSGEADRKAEVNQSVGIASVDSSSEYHQNTNLYYDRSTGQIMIAAGALNYQGSTHRDTYYFRLSGSGKAELLRHLGLIQSEFGDPMYSVDEKSADQETYLGAYESLLKNQTLVSLQIGGDHGELQRTSDFIRQFQAGHGERRISLWESGSTARLHSGVQLTAEDEADNLLSVRWESSNTDVATVDESGLATAVSQGGCYIRAYMEGTDICMAEYDVTVET